MILMLLAHNYMGSYYQEVHGSHITNTSISPLLQELLSVAQLTVIIAI